MKLIGKLKEYLYTDTDIVLSIILPKKFYLQAQKIPQDKLLDIDIGVRTGQRTLRQNRALWALISEITAAENGGLKPREYVNDTYVQLIEEANINVEYWEGLEEMIDVLQGDDNKKPYRVVKVVEHRKSAKGVDTVLLACYKGTSRFNTKEMNDLIDITLDRGREHGIDLLVYEEDLRR